MSLRALKKRENQQNANFSNTKQTIYKKSNANLIATQQRHKSLPNCVAGNLMLQQQLSRNSYSTPELHSKQDTLAAYDLKHLIRTKSENDISALVAQNKSIAVKSEVCLQTISTHNYQKVLNMHNSTSSLSMRSSAVSTTTLNTNASINSNENSSNVVLRVPIIGYEVMEERARFTVYKLRVENPLTNDCWLVLRRYTDFVRLNSKLKQSYPYMNLLLPRKKIFGDNFNAVFLDNRVQGLQMFVNTVMSKEELRKSKMVRDFFCLDEPPTYSESMEECRAIFEAQEETIAHLKLQINSKNELILSLQQKLREEIIEKQQLKMAINNLTTLNISEGSSNNSSTASN